MIVSEIRICYDKAAATTFDYKARLIQSFVAREYGLVDLPRQFVISFPINNNFNPAGWPKDKLNKVTPTRSCNRTAPPVAAGQLVQRLRAGYRKSRATEPQYNLTFQSNHRVTRQYCSPRNIPISRSVRLAR
jgi:hypothetical protein